MYLLCIVVFSVKLNQCGSDAPWTPPSGGVAGMSHWEETRTRWRDGVAQLKASRRNADVALVAANVSSLQSFMSPLFKYLTYQISLMLRSKFSRSF